MGLTLDITEDKGKVKEIFSNYLTQNIILNWKYELALNELITENLLMEPTERNIKKLGDMYLQEVLKVYESKCKECTLEEKEKIEELKLGFDKICSSSQIQKILHIAHYTRQVMNNSVVSRISSTNQQQPVEDNQYDDNQELNDYKSMTSIEKIAFLCEKFGDNGHLDLMKITIANRFRTSLLNIMNDLKFELQPTLTRQERDMLLKISECNDVNSINQLLNTFYANTSMDPMCRYIRLALSTIVELWSSDSLLTDHNESWYRTHIYGPVFDNAFIYDKDFVTKRADCISNITKEFDDIPNQRVDFILRNLNDDTDYLSAEEKPGLKGVKKDIGKGKVLQQAMLRKWVQHVGIINVNHLEAITCQWQGTFVVPKVPNHLASFSQTLAAVLSLQRLVYLNYQKINVILETKRKYEMEFMRFRHDYDDGDDKIDFRSDSTQGSPYNDYDPEIVDSSLEDDITDALKNIKSDYLTWKDWEEFIIDRATRKRKSPPN